MCSATAAFRRLRFFLICRYFVFYFMYVILIIIVVSSTLSVVDTAAAVLLLVVVILVFVFNIKQISFATATLVAACLSFCPQRGSQQNSQCQSQPAIKLAVVAASALNASGVAEQGLHEHEKRNLTKKQKNRKKKTNKDAAVCVRARTLLRTAGAPYL